MPCSSAGNGYDTTEVNHGSRRLNNNDVSSQERWRDLARGEHQRKVPGYDGCHYANGRVPRDDRSLLVVFYDIFRQWQVSHAPDPGDGRIRLGICLGDLIN